MSRIERRNREIERRQWAHTERQRTELRLKGYGEGYIQELFFGKAFSSPPEFSYSAVFDQVERPVWTNFVTSPRGSLSTGLDQYGMGNDSQSHYATIIEDPGFESQGKYLLLDPAAASIIPGTGEAFTKQHLEYYRWQLDPEPSVREFWLPLRWLWAWDAGYVNDWAPRFPEYIHDRRDDWDIFGPHRWLQTEDTRDRWSVTQADHHDLGVGEEGRCSATAVIGPNGYTNWLIPIAWDLDDFYWYHANGAGSTITDEVNAWRVALSAEEPFNQKELAGLRGSVPPPHRRGFRGVAHAKVESEATLEFSAVLSVWWDKWYGDVLTLENTNPLPASIFPEADQDPQYSDFYIPGQRTYFPDSFPYRELLDYREEHQLVPGDWSSVQIEVPEPEARSWPLHPDTLADLGRPNRGWWNKVTNKGRGNDNMWWTFRYRIKGTPGTTVYLDNIYMDWEWRNGEIPQLTIGVDEWIVDEAGAYIGARLWVTHGPTDNYKYRAE